MAKKAGTRDDYEHRILLAQEFISSQIDLPLRPLEVAKRSGFSVHHFHRIFRGLTGETMMGFARRLRLERAARQLRGSTRPVMDIALEAGYQSHEAFTRAFVAVFSCPPSEFKESESAEIVRAQIISKTPSVSVEVRQEEAVEALYMQHRGPYLGVGMVWQRLMGWLADSEVLVERDAGGTPVMYGLVPDDPDITEQDKLRYHACVVPKSAVAITGPVARTTIAKGKYAIAVHTGGYDTLHQTYLDLIGRWFPQSGLLPAPTPVVEFYLNSPYDTETEALRTEVRVQIQG